MKERIVNYIYLKIETSVLQTDNQENENTSTSHRRKKCLQISLSDKGMLSKNIQRTFEI